MSLEEELTQAMLQGYRETGLDTGYWANYFNRDVRRHGGLITAKKLLVPKQGEDSASGFQKLIDVGRTDLALEHLVISERFRSLFTSEELAEAKRRIESIPDYALRKSVKRESIHPETLSDTRSYQEGSVQQVLINRYERDPRARDACLEHHGYICKACGFDFEFNYGEIGYKFIHVHHNKPLALCRENYQINPIKDLAPVCPNCHAMLHTSDPPLSVHELKEKLKLQHTLRKNKKKK